MKLYPLIMFLLAVHVTNTTVCALRASVLTRLPLTARRVPRLGKTLMARPLPRRMPARTLCGNPYSWGDCTPCDIGCGLVGGMVGSACGTVAGVLAGGITTIPFSEEATEKAVKMGRYVGFGCGTLAGSALAGGPVGCIAYTTTIIGIALVNKR